MKKLYFLLFLFVTTLSFGQGSESFTNSNATGSYTDNNFVGDVGITWSYVASRDANGDANGSGISLPALMLRRNTEPSKITSSTIAGGIGDFSVKLYKGFTGAGNRQVELFINGASFGTSTVFDDFNEHIFTVTGINQPGDIVIEIVNVTTRQVIIDDITWTGYTGAATPSLNISSPSNATVFSPNTTNVNVSMSVLNFNVDTPSNGDGYIVYNVNGGASVNKFDTTDIAVPVTEGQSYTVNLELVDNSGNSLSTPITATVTFSVDSYTVVTSISQIRTDVIANGTGKFYHLNSEAIVTYARPLANRNQKYIQDATAAILIDDNGGVITNTFNIGDGMTGFKGQTSTFSGVLQIIPMEDIAPNAPGFSITPQVVTVDDLINDMTNNNYETYESELVKINGVTFADGNGSNTFAVNTNYNITDTNTMAFRTMFAEANYVVNADLIPVGATDIIVLAARFNSTPQVVSRDLADLTLSTNSFNAIDGLKMYPNPVSGSSLFFTSTNNVEMNVQIFDILGKEVKNTQVMNNQVNIAGLNAGVYIVKITEAGKTATRKLIVK